MLSGFEKFKVKSQIEELEKKIKNGYEYTLKGANDKLADESQLKNLKKQLYGKNIMYKYGIRYN